MGKLDGKVVVITGAGSGMGRAMAELFSQEGAKVVAGEWNAKSLDDVVGAIRGVGGEITGVQGNVAVKADAEKIVDTAKDTYGRIDVLCNNAGVMDHNHGVGDLPDEMWERVLGINLNGPMYLTRRAIPHMLEQGGGSIINTASVAGLSGAAAGVAYTTSKHGLIGLTKNTAWLYAQRGIRCNAICPGGVETNIMASIDPTKMDPVASARLQVFYNTMPAALKPHDIAHMALFLASDESRFINGQAIAADAGWTAT